MNVVRSAFSVSSSLQWRGLLIAVISGIVPATGIASDGHQPHGGMLRFPDVSATKIVFVYANDLWLVPRTGGVATPLASPPGAELLPKFSPDGSQIAFVGNYEGNRDLYVIPTEGGISRRVTYHPAAEQLCDWTPDGQLLYMTNGFAGLARQQQLYMVPTSGVMPSALPVPYGANGAVSADGEWLAYTPHAIDFRTWKRYRGGMQTDIWLLNLKSKQSRQITDWEGMDTLPMWHGKTVYYLCDTGKNHRLNIWAYDTASAQRRQITDFAEYDVKWPSIGPGADGGGEIVFQYGPKLYLLDLKTEQSTPVEVEIPGDRPKLRRRQIDADEWISSWDISPTGARAVFSARGDIWTVPSRKGAPRRLTRSDGAFDRDGTWSPDGQWIAYLSDDSGEYELYVVQSDGKSAARRVTKDGACFRFMASWSPNSKQLLFTDKTGAIYICTLETGEVKQIEKDPWSDQVRPNWSRDSRWLVYSMNGENRNAAIWLYDVAKGERHQVTSGMFDDVSPCFDRDGDFIYFASHRDFSSPVYEDLGTTWVYSNTSKLVAVPLRRDVKSPLAPQNDEEKPSGDADKKDGDKKESKEGDKAGAEKGDGDKPESGESKDKDEKKKEVKPVEIDLEGFEARALELPVDRGQFYGLCVNDKGQLIYTRAARGSGDKPSIRLLDLKDEKADKKEEKTVAADVAEFVMSDDGKKLLIRKDAKSYFVVDAAVDQKLEKSVPLSGMRIDVDPRAEWCQIFMEAWRLHRDYFYVSNMHGMDWQAVRRQYEPMLADCTSREDVTYVIGEMISELNVGHAYVRGLGDTDKEPSVAVGMLSCDFSLENGAYRIGKIHEGGPWDTDARSPLRAPGNLVNEGEYLLAVNGVPVDVTRDPWAAFQGLAGATVTLTVSEKPAMDDKAREVLVTTLPGEGSQRYRAWIERNRKYVADRSDGRVGYIYVPNTGVDGQNDLVRQFHGQKDKAALIIDERWNGGGQIPTRFIELLNRPVTNYWARRDGRDWMWPPDSQQGPKCMLINGLAGSGGDMFPWLFRHNKLGQLIGTRTWGGLVGISGNPSFIDGGNTNVPTFGFYETDGTWGVEGHGVDPDILVVDDPAQMQDGADPQLDRAISLMLEEIKRHPYAPPKRPDSPDRRGMGLPETDR
ncbi:MAG: PD40 domain-containing protein [Phycisphaerae bacterium]|nr:PD40 domain-containing protein [Phycisphaerae bacterium]